MESAGNARSRISARRAARVRVAATCRARALASARRERCVRAARRRERGRPRSPARGAARVRPLELCGCRACTRCALRLRGCLAGTCSRRRASCALCGVRKPNLAPFRNCRALFVMTRVSNALCTAENSLLQHSCCTEKQTNKHFCILAIAWLVAVYSALAR